MYADVIAGNEVITRLLREDDAKVGRRYVGESKRTTFVKSRTRCYKAFELFYQRAHIK